MGIINKANIYPASSHCVDKNCYTVSMFKKILVSLMLVASLFTVSASDVEARTIRVRGYTTRRGTYVNSYYKTSPNRYKFDNYSSKGNYNPYTGRTGTINWWR